MASVGLDKAHPRPRPTRTHGCAGVTARSSMFVASAKRRMHPGPLHVEVEAAADDVEVAVDQSGQNATATQVYRACRGADQRHNIVLLSLKTPFSMATALAAGRVGLRVVNRPSYAARAAGSFHPRWAALCADCLGESPLGIGAPQGSVVC
jgi:hypothetical protein